MINPLLTQGLLLDQAGAVQPPPVAPAPVAGPSFQIVVPPDESNRREVQGPQTTTHVPTAGATDAMANLVDANDREAAALDAQKAPAFANAEAEATGADAQTTIQQYGAIERQRAMEEHQRKVAALSAQTEKRRQAEEAAAHPTTYWEDKGTPAKIVASFLVGLGQFGAGMKGGSGRNAALDILNQAEAEDRQRKLDTFTRAKEFRQLAEKDQEAAKDALADKLAEITQWEITKGNVIKSQVAAIAKRSGIPAAQAKADEMSAQIDAKNAEKQAQLGQHWDKVVQSGRVTDTQTLNRTGTPKAGAPDLTALDANGKPYGTWRSLQEAEKGRDAQTALTGFRGAIDELNAHLVKNGRLIDPTSPEKAERDALVGNASRYLQKLNDAGVLNPGEYERNQKQLSSGILKSGENAAKANDLMIHSAERTYEASLKGKAVRGESAPASQQPVTVPAARAPAQTRVLNGKTYRKDAAGRWHEGA